VDNIRKTDPLKYQKPAPSSGQSSKELMTVKLRYKKPDEDKSTPIDFPIVDAGTRLNKATADFKFAASVAGFGMLLRDSKHKGTMTFDAVLKLAEQGKGNDPGDYRAEFINLVRAAKKLPNR
jgi:Ca-activated chloride channel family protein